ncbi:MAG: molybdopterin converting factor subunit 1 [Bacillota bacterium]|nr:MAG: molybdopterin converting factor subunit 1 [Bacillota bacterium]
MGTNRPPAGSGGGRNGEGATAGGAPVPGGSTPGSGAGTGATVRVRLFAAVAERWGERELQLAVPPGATAATVVEYLRARRPEMAQLLDACRLAVNGRYAEPGQPVRGGDEVALIPPVSGGAPERREGGGRFFVTDRPLSLDELFRHVARPEHGAVVLFVGITRRFTGDRETRYLEYEAYAEMAAGELARIGAEAEERWPGARLAIGHRVGRVDIGEASVVIAAAAPHRPDAFAAARYAIEELKRRAPIWKKEHYVDGSVEWVGVGPEPGVARPSAGGERER